MILTRDFSKEQYVLPEDDMRYAIETCRSILSVFVCLFVFLALQTKWFYFHSPVADFSLLVFEVS